MHELIVYTSNGGLQSGLQYDMTIIMYWAWRWSGYIKGE